MRTLTLLNIDTNLLKPACHPGILRTNPQNEYPQEDPLMLRGCVFVEYLYFRLVCRNTLVVRCPVISQPFPAQTGIPLIVFQALCVGVELLHLTLVLPSPLSEALLLLVFPFFLASPRSFLLLSRLNGTLCSRNADESTVFRRLTEGDSKGPSTHLLSG